MTEWKILQGTQHAASERRLPSSQALGCESGRADGTTSPFTRLSCTTSPGLLTPEPRTGAHTPLGKARGVIQDSPVPPGAAPGGGCRKPEGAGSLLRSCCNLCVGSLQVLILPLLHPCSALLQLYVYFSRLLAKTCPETLGACAPPAGLGGTYGCTRNAPCFASRKA